MKMRLEDEVRRWLGAEEDGLDGVADRALARALAGLEHRGPTPGFADRVLSRTGRLAPVAGVWRSWWLRFPVAASLLTAGLTAAVLLPAGVVVVGFLGRTFAGSLLAASWHAMARWTTIAFRWWGVVADVVEALGASLATPAAIAILSANVLLAAASLLGLKRLLKPPEELMPW